MLAITGDTYDIREQLKALGCRWEDEQRFWSAPDETIRAEGQALADAEPWRKWREYMDTLAWAEGAFTATAWEAGLNARSRGIPLEAAMEEIRARIVAAGRTPEPGWIERNVGRAFEKAEPPKEKAVHGPTWPQVWREEMKWVGSVAVGVTRVEGIPTTGEEFFCSRYALRFLGLKQGQDVSEGQLEAIKRMDAHLRLLRQRAEAAEVPPPAKPEFEETKLAKFTGAWARVADTAWLADRSPIDPLTVTPADFLAALYEPGEKVVAFDVYESQGQWLYSRETGFEPSEVDHQAWGGDKLHAAAPPTKRGREFTGSGVQGVWYLCNPVSGEFRQTGERDKWERPKWSRRFDQTVTTFRYFALESDDADPRQWVGAMVQLPLPIAAIYTSGGGPTRRNAGKRTSVHVLVRVNAGSKAEFDLFRETAKRVMIPLGADRQCMSAVRLTRLPGCMRELDKDGELWPSGAPQLQKLLYLDPSASAEPICSLAPARDSLEVWEQWVRAAVQWPVADVPLAELAKVEWALRWYRGERAMGLLEELRRWKG